VVIEWLDAQGSAAAGRKLTVSRELGKKNASKEKGQGLLPAPKVKILSG
jgi:hypothetical protein